MQLISTATITALFSLALAGDGYAQSENQFLKTTHVYKEVESCSIKLDVIQSSAQMGAQMGANRRDSSKPAIVYIHGGSLVMGSRETITGVARGALEWLVLEEDYILVSIDYRLAPETKLPEILTDIEDAFRWVREEGAELYRIDPDRIAAVGASAGGYLAMTAGFRLQEPPQVIVSVSGYGAFGPWAIKPGRLELPPVTLQEALDCMGDVTVSNGEEDRRCDALNFYIFGRQHGRGYWPESVTGFDLVRSPAEYVGLSPIHNVSAKFPPTLLVHGDNDEDVPYLASVQMADELSIRSIDNELFIVHGAGHTIQGAPSQTSDVVSRRILNYLYLHLGTK